MASRSSLKIEAELKNLSAIRRFVEARASQFNLDEELTYDLLLIVDEMATNIISHGYGGRSGQIEIEIHRAGSALIIRLRDEAPPFDPTQVPSPDITLPLELRPTGGLGIHLARELTDRMTHRITSQGGNELTLVKEGIFSTPAEESINADYH